MKLTGREAKRHVERPIEGVAGTLLFGPDPAETAVRRERLARALAGEDGELVRLAGPAVQRDPAALSDALRSRGFFSARTVVVIEGAGDGVGKAVEAALEDLRGGDAALVVSAGDLKPKGALRKLFEAHAQLAAVGVYSEPPDREEIAAMLKAARIASWSPEAMDALAALAEGMEAEEFRALIEKLALYLGEGEGALRAEDVAACAPAQLEAELDELVAAVAKGEVERLPIILRRLAAQGAAPTGLLIATSRHFRQAFEIASAPDGPEAAAGRARPPLFGPRRSLMVAHVRRLGREGIENALRALLEADLALRSPNPPPAQALVERTLMRLAMQARQRR
ncbi:DNA polymerase III subunit delta [Oceanicella actignis]|uniref:DNA-directed DNA polymerase n=1 Tax=Oceanicella actignis TaxID=1189325 RepID=A0A1M7T2F9_9RHOB|nr:hypothetical protein [Oceanicella actignis]SET38900.1 DNA polymerase III, delta subunit [Oceanicella actignis]SHN64888.1 DNA polymerase III, delta subunit [Oceanicella actignis]